MGSISYWCITIAPSVREIWVTKQHLCFSFHKYCELQSSVAPGPVGVSPPQMHNTGSMYLSTFSKSKSDIHRRLHFRAITSQSALIRGQHCCVGIPPQHYRRVETVEFHPNFPYSNIDTPPSEGDCHVSLTAVSQWNVT